MKRQNAANSRLRTGGSLCALLFFAVAGAALSAAAKTETVGGVTYTYSVSGGKATIDSGREYAAAIPSTTKGALSVPSKLGGCPVVAIGPFAFYECASLTSVSIPQGVTTIGKWAFRECVGLKSISLPSGITSIEEQAFGNTGLLSIAFPSGLKKLKSGETGGVLDACDHLQSVTFPASLTEFEGWAIMDCPSLVSFTFLGNAPKFPADALYNCPTGKITVQVPKGSTGWGVSIPGTWKGMKIVFSAEESPTPVPSAKYTVRFSANGGKGKTAAQTMTVGKAAKLRKNAFTRSGYVFIGWAKTKKGAVAYKNAASVKNLAAKGKTVTLYAKWAKKSYKVAFYANGGKLPKGKKMPALKMTYGKAKKLTANKFTRKGYVFKGWAKSKALAKKGKVAYKNKKSVKNLTTTGKTIKLYAVWKKKSSSSGGGSSSSSSSSSSGEDSPANLSYTVLFDANGGAGTMYAQDFDHDESKALQANAYERPGFVFAGWAKTAGGAVAYSDRQTVRNLSNGAAVWLYAVWRSDPSNPATTLSFCGLSFVTDSKAPWTRTSFDGISALVSAGIGDGEKSTLYLTVTGPGTISFKMRTNSEPGKDMLRFSHPGGSLSKSGGSDYLGWENESFSIPSGTHVLTWTYEKDASGSQGSDCGWIADVVWSK